MVGTQCFVVSSETRPHWVLISACPLTKLGEWNVSSFCVYFFTVKSSGGQEVVVHAFNPNTQEVEAGRSLWVQGQPGLQELVPEQALKLQKNPFLKNKPIKQARKRGRKEETRGWVLGLASSSYENEDNQCQVIVSAHPVWWVCFLHHMVLFMRLFLSAPLFVDPCSLADS